jgi:hypothetical protein
MIDFESLEFGDKIYVVKERNHIMTAKRIKMVDSDGVEWYRYDKPKWTFEIEEITYCGKVTYVEEGEVRFSEDRIGEYHFRWSSGQIHYEYDDPYNPDTENWFHTREEAEACIEKLKVIRLGE